MDQAPDLMMAAAEAPIERGYLPVVGGVESRRRALHQPATRAFADRKVRSEPCHRPERCPLARFAEGAAPSQYLPGPVSRWIDYNRAIAVVLHHHVRPEGN